MAWREAGSGPGLVFLHGIGSGSQGWNAQLEHFAPSYRAIAWDAPGYGGSEDLEADAPSAGDYAEALAGLLTALEIDAAHLVGNSLGSLFAGAFAGSHRRRVLSMVLSDPAIGHAEADPKARAEALASRLDGVNRLGPAEMARKRAPRVVAPGTPAEILDGVRTVMAGVRPRGYS
ncbi:MAG: alpha/beta fold hydrolase, partial [Alphaproteobacteria bacterium]